MPRSLSAPRICFPFDRVLVVSPATRKVATRDQADARRLMQIDALIDMTPPGLIEGTRDRKRFVVGKACAPVRGPTASGAPRWALWSVERPGRHALCAGLAHRERGTPAEPLRRPPARPAARRGKKPRVSHNGAPAPRARENRRIFCVCVSHYATQSVIRRMRVKSRFDHAAANRSNNPLERMLCERDPAAYAGGRRVP